MKEKAKLTLEYVIRELDKEVRSSELGSWKAQAEKEAESGDEETLRQAYINLRIIWDGQQALDDTVGEILVAENILTPSLITKGWQFWKQPLLTKNQREAIQSAIIRWSEAEVAQLNSLEDAYENLPDEDAHSGVMFLASMLDIASSCRQQLSTDLKKILASAEDE